LGLLDVVIGPPFWAVPLLPDRGEQYLSGDVVPVESDRSQARLLLFLEHALILLERNVVARPLLGQATSGLLPDRRVARLVAHLVAAHVHELVPALFDEPVELGLVLGVGEVVPRGPRIDHR